MDFFASQDLARRKTKWLIGYFILAVVGMILGIYIVIALVMFGYPATQVPAESVDPALERGIEQLFNLPLLGVVSAFVLLIVGGGTAYKVVELNGGGSTVAAQLGGRRLQTNSRDPVERRILNVVEEMAIASGTPVPPVYMLDNEPGINAFAAGFSVDDAVIGVNRGTVEQLNRDELTGVIAHEFSHILNGDMRMSIRMIGVLHGIQVLALIGYYVLRSMSYSRGSNKDSGRGAILAIALALIVFGGIGLFFARLIKASVSRQREFLADASAVQFTRNPDGIGGALKMIGASQHGSQVNAARAEVASHMFFASMFGRGMTGAFATHPPLLKRIQAIEPRFEGNYQEYLGTRSKITFQTERAESKSSAAGKMPIPPLSAGGKFGGIFTKSGAATRFPIDPVMVIAAVGLPTQDDVEYSSALVEALPESITDAARDVFAARCLTFAVLIQAGQSELNESQLRIIAKNEGEGTAEETIRLLKQVAQVPPQFRLPVFEIIQGTLVGMSANQFQTFRATIDELVKSDGKISLFEFFLQHHLIIHLDRFFGNRTTAPINYRELDAVQKDVIAVIGVLVKAGHSDSASAESAFLEAMESLERRNWGVAGELQNVQFTSKSLADSLIRLSEAAPLIKKQVLLAAAIAINHDGQVTVEEAELFRAISESLDCPVPPVVASKLKKGGLS
ncbi:MAG TPA: M48 family metallopeptidase [Pirellulaceae bacterium]|nr:M48 family metallopeptidase [Pirellulaceae bacterium]HMO91935.1 M48 family metallopeptidase [Pirellulaceae bacterium]HMP68734.1 M48 family metallopeptidase [Pirellulaceae bacterium]